MSLPRTLAASASALILAACAVGPHYQAPSLAPVALTTLDPHLAGRSLDLDDGEIGAVREGGARKLEARRGGGGEVRTSVKLRAYVFEREQQRRAADRN